jgi:hypothetical protein
MIEIGLKVGLEKFQDIDVGRTKDDSVPTDQGLYLFVLCEILGQFHMIYRFIGLGFFSTVVNNPPSPRTEKDIFHALFSLEGWLPYDLAD